MTTSVIVAGARTPIGKLLGAFTSLTAPELGALAIRAAVERSGIAPEDLDAVLLGNVVQAGVGAGPARQAAIAGGVPLSVPATTINKLCLSGLTTIAQADLAIRAGYFSTALAGGFESMTNAPYVVRNARKGFKYGGVPLDDALDRDALICSIDGETMGAATERYQSGFGFTRHEQDEFAADSHRKANAATEGGLFDEEIVPVTIRGRGGDVVVDRDEGIRAGTTADKLGELRPAFSKEGTVTAGSASQLSDGAAALVVMSRAEAERRGLPWIAEILSYGTHAGPDPSLLLQPAGAIRDALTRAGDVSLDELSVVEINEAFAGVALASIRELGIDPSRVNPNGGAIALGHPVGMSGARLVLTLALELRRRGGGLGAAALCGGGGQGDALLIRVP